MPPCASDTCTQPSRWWRLGRHRGAMLDGQWLCSQGCVEASVRARLAGSESRQELPARMPGIRLGTLLSHRRVVRPEQLSAALEAQAESRLRLGAQLRAMGIVDAQALLRALAEQAGVSYLAAVDPTRVHDGPGGLSLDAIHALRLVPIGAPDQGRIRFVFSAPVPRTALAIFRQQTGWAPEPYLVSDDDWLALLEHYGAGRRGGATGGEAATGFARERDADEAVRRLAQMVMASGDVRMREARWGHYVWARLQGTGAAFDLLLDAAPEGATEGADPWLAVTTSR